MFDGEHLRCCGSGLRLLAVDLACRVTHLLAQLLTLFRAQVTQLFTSLGAILELPARPPRATAVAIPPATGLQGLRGFGTGIGRHDVDTPTLQALLLLASHVVAEFAQTFATLHHHFVAIARHATAATALSPRAG